MKKNIIVSIRDPIKEDTNGATNQILSLNLSNTCTSINWATIKADPEPIAILIDIKSEKFVERKRVKETPTIKPRYTIFRATFFPKLLFDRSVIKKVMG